MKKLFLVPLALLAVSSSYASGVMMNSIKRCMDEARSISGFRHNE